MERKPNDDKPKRDPSKGKRPKSEADDDDTVAMLVKLLGNLNEETRAKVDKQLCKPKKTSATSLNSVQENDTLPNHQTPVNPTRGTGFYPHVEKDRRLYLRGKALVRSVVKECHDAGVFRVDQSISELSSAQIQQFTDHCLQRKGFGDWDISFFENSLMIYKKGLKSLCNNPNQERTGLPTKEGKQTKYKLTFNPETCKFTTEEKMIVDLTGDDAAKDESPKKKRKLNNSEASTSTARKVKQEIFAKDLKDALLEAGHSPMTASPPSRKHSPVASRSPTPQKRSPTPKQKTPSPKKKKKIAVVVEPKTTPQRAAKKPYLSPDAKKKMELEKNGTPQYEFYDKLRAIGVGEPGQDIDDKDFELCAFGQVIF
jgi:hypothetical protein